MTLLRKHLLATTLVALALALTACGGSSDEDDVRSAAENFASAFTDENWSEVCGLMTKGSKAQLEGAGEVLQVKGGCEDVWKKVANRVPKSAKQQLENLEIDTVKVSGNKATVTTTSSKGEPAQLRKEDGEWKFDFEG